MTSIGTPPGWPGEVRAPGAPGWEDSARGWLLDLCPPEYRTCPPVRDEPVVLARFAVLHVEACRDACRRGLSAARSDLRPHVDRTALERAVAAWLHEEARLDGVRRAVGLVEEAVRGRRWAVRL